MFYTKSEVCSELLEKTATRSKIQLLQQAQRASKRGLGAFNAQAAEVAANGATGKDAFNAMFGGTNLRKVRRQGQLVEAANNRKARLGALTPAGAGWVVPQNQKHMGWKAPFFTERGIPKGTSSWAWGND